MSDDNKNSESFDDFDFNVFNEEESPEKSGETFDLDNPFGDDWAAAGNDAGVNADNPYFDDSAIGDSVEDSPVAESSEIEAGGVPPITAGEEKTDKKKKGLLGGLFGGGKTKAPKEKKAKEKQPKTKKEKAPKSEEGTDKPAVPRDWGTILCIAFSVFLLVSLLMLNIATFLTSGNSLMLTLCFLGAFNIAGLALAAVPILFYKFPQERTLPNVMLGISVGAMFTGVLFLVIEFSRYDFLIRP